MEATTGSHQEPKPPPAAARAPVEVTLRRFELSDVDAVMAWVSDPLVAARCRWDAYESTEPALAFIRDVVLPHPWFRAICVDGHPVGAMSVTPTGDPCRAELGYVVARAHWGRGVATAAVRRAVAAVFGEVEGLRRVEALVDVANPASQRVLEKAGFTREAVLRRYGFIKGDVKDMVIFSFIDTDPLVDVDQWHWSLYKRWHPRHDERLDQTKKRKGRPATATKQLSPAMDEAVTLRRFELSDVDAMMAWASDPEVAAFCRWEPYESREALRAYLRDTVLPHPWFRAVCVSGAVAGAVSVAPTAEPRRGELGYVLARAHWGKGVATAAVRRALRALFADAEAEGLVRVEALVDVDNPASQRVAEKAGLRREGVLRRHYWHKGRARDMVMYSFLASDPLPDPE